MKSVAFAAFLLGLAACGVDPGAVSSAPQTAPATIAAVTATTWNQAQSDALIKSIDGALMDAVATQIVGSAPTTAPLPINVTAACDKAFASNGSISVLGSYNFGQNVNSPGRFTLTLTYDTCPLKTADGNTVTIHGIGLQIAASLATSTAADGTVTYVFTYTTVLGTLTLSTDSADIPCAVDATSAATYAWNDTMTFSGTYSGSFCALTLRGQLAQTQALTVP